MHSLQADEKNIVIKDLLDKHKVNIRCRIKIPKEEYYSELQAAIVNNVEMGIIVHITL